MSATPRPPDPTDLGGAERDRLLALARTGPAGQHEVVLRVRAAMAELRRESRTDGRGLDRLLAQVATSRPDSPVAASIAAYQRGDVDRAAVLGDPDVRRALTALLTERRPR